MPVRIEENGPCDNVVVWEFMTDYPTTVRFHYDYIGNAKTVANEIQRLENIEKDGRRELGH